MRTYGKPGKKVVVSEFGETPLDAIEHFVSLEEQLPPDPADLDPADVVVAVRSAAVGWVDLLMSSGQYQHMASPPYTPGLESAGVIVWAGPMATGVRVGESVIVDGVLAGPRSKGAYQAYGGFASYMVAPSNAVMPLPARLSFDQAASFLGNYETAYHCLIARGQLRAGETVLIHGASGSTGLAAVHLAKLIGATVIATGRSLAKLETIRAHGADHLVRTIGDSGAVARFRDEVKALTNGKGVDVIYDSVGGDISIESLHCAAFDARFLIVGWASTPFVAKGKGQRGAPNVNMLPTNLIMMKSLRVLGSPAVISAHQNPQIRVERLRDLFKWVDEGKLTPCTPEVFAFADVKEAMRAKWESRFVGGCALHPAL
jgi:NADPH2:quinone reductase